MNIIFVYSSIVLSIILCLMTIFNIFSRKSYKNSIINFFVCNWFVLIIVYCLLNEQIHLGKFILVNTLFVLSVLTSFFYLDKQFYIEHKAEPLGKKRIAVYTVLFVFLLFISFFNILKIKESKLKNEILTHQAENQLLLKQDYKDLLDNKLFQNISEIVFVYTGIVVALLFFKKEKVNNER